MDIKFTLQAQYSGTQFIAGPFNLSGTTDTNITYELATNINKSTLLTGYTVTTPYNITGGTIQSLGSCIMTPAESYTLQFSSGPIIIGNFDTYSGISSNGIVKLNDVGSIDYSFNVGTGIPTGPKSSFVGPKGIKIQSDGKLLVGLTTPTGNVTSFYNNEPCYGIIRLNPDGSRDYSFNAPTFFSGAGGSVSTITTFDVQSSGKIIVGTTQTTGFGRIVRLNTDGSIDNTFNIWSGLTGSNIIDSSPDVIRVDSDDKILVGGCSAATKNGIFRLMENGVMDTSFNVGTGFNSGYFVTTIEIENDGRILVGGTFMSYNGVTSYGIVRLNTYGNMDTSFSPLTLTGAPTVTAIAVQPDNNIIIGGFFTTINNPGVPTNYIARILPTTGTKDLSFTGSGFTVLGATGFNCLNSISLLPNGSIFVTGLFTNYNGTSINQMVKITSDGSLDTTFVVATESITLCDTFASIYIT